MRITRVFALVFSALLAVVATAQDAPEGQPPTRNRGERGNFDPAQMQERMLNRQKEQLGLADQDWEAIKPLLTAVSEKQRAVRELQSRGFGRGGRGGQAPAVEVVDAVTKAIESNDAEAIKRALGELRAARLVREAELKKAQESLREVLSVQQEARLVLSGMLE